jgi:hypothetical protein
MNRIILKTILAICKDYWSALAAIVVAGLLASSQVECGQPLRDKVAQARYSALCHSR